MAAFTQLTPDYTLLTDAEKVALFKTTAVDEPTVADLQTITQFKVLIYKEV